MSDKREKPSADGEEGGSEDGGPGLLFQPFVIMEELLDKLKLLDYEAGFCKQYSFKPFSRLGINNVAIYEFITNF